MGSVWQPTYRAADGTKKRLRKWWIAYKDEHGKRVTVPGYHDKKATIEKMRQLEIRVDRIRAGLPVEGQGQVHMPIVAACAEHEAELRRLGRTRGYIVETRRCIHAIVDGCKWTSLASIKADEFRRFLSSLADAGKSARTVNHHREKLSALLRFCLDQGWLLSDPIARIRNAPTANRKPMARRAFTPEEFARFIQAIPSKRRTPYLIAALSGFRRLEMKLCEKQDIAFDPKPRWQLRADIQKSRRPDVVPMLPEAVEHVRPLWDRLVLPTDRLFVRFPTAVTFNEDLERAGIAKIDHRGRRLGIHSLRYFFCTELAKVMPIQIVSRLMRHASIKITADLYMDLGVEDLRAEVDKLPSILPAELSQRKGGPEPKLKRPES